MAGRRGKRSSPCFGGSSDGWKAARKGNYWKVLEGMGSEACEQFFRDALVAVLEHSTADASSEDHEQHSLDDILLREPVLKSVQNLSSVRRDLDSSVCVDMS
ncbi:hypothetical protein IEQ34_002621 [Dendrobium chrysotoxum]|uniref:Uncharacterized protein n=1 Tax=Dendrobium chrysotoxum TaxID=161865 RepID=A0AAV7HJ69_DENCH|nr:hypothetical protein IEQ34_002621 [Dendrobium chrysotoxum]